LWIEIGPNIIALRCGMEIEVNLAEAVRRGHRDSGERGSKHCALWRYRKNFNRLRKTPPGLN
jgi:hypothetical protein